jgi:hypothetical protein
LDGAVFSPIILVNNIGKSPATQIRIYACAVARGIFDDIDPGEMAITLARENADKNIGGAFVGSIFPRAKRLFEKGCVKGFGVIHTLDVDA